MKRLRGLWVLLTGILLLFATDRVYKSRATAEDADNRSHGWQLFIEPSQLEEGAVLAGVVSLGLGLVLLVFDLARTGRGRKTLDSRSATSQLESS